MNCHVLLAFYLTRFWWVSSLYVRSFIKFNYEIVRLAFLIMDNTFYIFNKIYIKISKNLYSCILLCSSFLCFVYTWFFKMYVFNMLFATISDYLRMASQTRNFFEIYAVFFTRNIQSDKLLSSWRITKTCIGYLSTILCNT